MFGANVQYKCKGLGSLINDINKSTFNITCSSTLEDFEAYEWPTCARSKYLSLLLFIKDEFVFVVAVEIDGIFFNL